MKKIFSFVAFGVVIFVIGAFGGLLADYVIFSKVITHPVWSENPIIKAFDNRVRVIRSTERIVVENNESIADIASRASTSVVYLEADQSDGTRITGDGIIVGSDGVIATTIDLAEADPGLITIKLADHSVHTPQSVYTDPYSGVSFVRIDKQDLATMPFANSDDARSGKRLIGIMQSRIDNDTHFASTGLLGHMYGFSIASPVSDHLQGVLEIDLADRISRESIGAPVVDYEGNMVGLIAQKKTPTSPETSSTRYYAIAANDVYAAFEDFLRSASDDASAEGILLGVDYEIISSVDVHNEGLDVNSGARIIVPETYQERVLFTQSLAARSGIIGGDIIITVNNSIVDTRDNLSRLMHDLAQTDKPISLKVMRGEQLLTIEVPVEE